MMYNHGHMGFWGMHAFWWAFWLALILGSLALLRQYSNRPPSENDSSLEILNKRYARGEISSEEYEERKSHLMEKPSTGQEAKS